MRALLLLWILGLAACAAPWAAGVPRAAPFPVAQRSVHPLPEASCDPEVARFGPVTAGLWSRAGGFGCRTGPSPRAGLARELARDAALKRCLDHAGPGTLELQLGVSGDGALGIEAINEAATVGQRACAELVLRTRAMALGCRWAHVYRHTVFELSGP